LVTPIEDEQNDQEDRHQEIPINDCSGIAGGKVTVLDHVDDMGPPCSPHECGFGYD